MNTKIINDNYYPHNFHGSVITPIFKTSTFCFKTAEEGEKTFNSLLNKSNDKPSFVYSRMNNPNMEITEKNRGNFLPYYFFKT